LNRLDPRAIDGTTGRLLLVVNDPETVVERAIEAGATETSRSHMSTVGNSVA